MKDIRLICCDLDGTLLRGDKSLSSENVRWIRRVREEKGIPFAFITGRTNLSVRRYFRTIGFNGPSSCLNGCMIWDELLTPLTSHLLPSEVLSSIVRAQRRTKVELMMVNGNTWFTESSKGYLYDAKPPIYVRNSVLCRFTEVEAANKVIFMSPDPSGLERLSEVLREEIKDEKAVTLYPGRDFLEIMPGGINKGTGLVELASMLGIGVESIMVIGDDLNDTEMFRRAGFSVAMGNARPEVKALADWVTLDNESDGVAHAIEKLFFSGDNE